MSIYTEAIALVNKITEGEKDENTGLYYENTGLYFRVKELKDRFITNKREILSLEFNLDISKKRLESYKKSLANLQKIPRTEKTAEILERINTRTKECEDMELGIKQSSQKIEALKKEQGPILKELSAFHSLLTAVMTIWTFLMQNHFGKNIIKDGEDLNHFLAHLKVLETIIPDKILQESKFVFNKHLTKEDQEDFLTFKKELQDYLIFLKTKLKDATVSAGDAEERNKSLGPHAQMRGRIRQLNAEVGAILREGVNPRANRIPKQSRANSSNNNNNNSRSNNDNNNNRSNTGLSQQEIDNKYKYDVTTPQPKKKSSHGNKKPVGVNNPPAKITLPIRAPIQQQPNKNQKGKKVPPKKPFVSQIPPPKINPLGGTPAKPIQQQLNKGQKGKKVPPKKPFVSQIPPPKINPPGGTPAKPIQQPHISNKELEIKRKAKAYLAARAAGINNNNNTLSFPSKPSPKRVEDLDEKMLGEQTQQIDNLNNAIKDLQHDLNILYQSIHDMNEEINLGKNKLNLIGEEIYAERLAREQAIGTLENGLEVLRTNFNTLANDFTILADELYSKINQLDVNLFQLNENINHLQANIANEIQALQLSINHLATENKQVVSDFNRISQELTEQISNLRETFTTNLRQERTDRATAITNLQKHIGQEMQSQTDGIYAHFNSIIHQIQAQINLLSQKISDIQKIEIKLNQEILDRTDGDAALENKIGHERDKRKKGDNQIIAALKHEINQRANADTELEELLKTEVETLHHKDADLKNSLDLLTNALRGEIQLRESNDNRIRTDFADSMDELREDMMNRISDLSLQLNAERIAREDLERRHEDERNRVNTKIAADILTAVNDLEGRVNARTDIQIQNAVNDLEGRVNNKIAADILAASAAIQAALLGEIVREVNVRVNNGINAALPGIQGEIRDAVAAERAERQAAILPAFDMIRNLPTSILADPRLIDMINKIWSDRLQGGIGLPVSSVKTPPVQRPR